MSKMRARLFSGIALAVVILGAGVTNASVVVYDTTAGGLYNGVGPVEGSPKFIGDKFGVSTSGWLDTITLPLNNDFSFAGPLANGTLTLWSDNGGAVGTPLFLASVSATNFLWSNTLLPPFSIISANGSAPVFLAAGSDYWLTLSQTTGSGGLVFFSNVHLTSAESVYFGGYSVPQYNYGLQPMVVAVSVSTVPSPILSIAPMSFLCFSNLTVGGAYHLEQSVAWYWTNQPVSFTATNAVYTQMFEGVVRSGEYRLALSPVPAQASATAVVDYGFVVHATITSGGSGYVTSPAVTIVGGGGTSATAVSQISAGVVTNITITDAGSGYTNTPTVEIAPPPVAAVSARVLPVMRVDSASLAPYDNYQIQFKSNIGAAWGNWNGGLFSPTDVTNSQYLFITNGTGFFRLHYVP